MATNLSVSDATAVLEDEDMQREVRFMCVIFLCVGGEPCRSGFVCGGEKKVVGFLLVDRCQRTQLAELEIEESSEPGELNSY